VATHGAGPCGSAATTGRHILEVRDRWSHPAPAAAGRGHEIQRWLLLVDGPPVYDAGESWVREVIVSAFAEDGTWWMDVS
jgi:hypothetical protein